MKLYKTILVAFLSGLFANNSMGQTRECLTMQMDSLRRSDHNRAGASQAFETWLASKRYSNSTGRTASITYSIPVVVHVVHNGEPLGEGANISYAQVQSQIEVLNEDFRRKEGTNGFNNDPVGVDTRIEFYLAPVDPVGNVLAEPGIDRIHGGRAEWPTGVVQNPIEFQLKPVTIWDPARYFNIWTVNFGGFIGRNLLGYAQFPDMSGLEGLNEDEGGALTDGVVIGYPYFGSSEKGDFPSLFAPFDLGRTTTHEVGHWLGLRHIWGDGNCFIDDFVGDTPPANQPTNGCPTEVFSCTVESMFENYMDYTDDACMNIFTEGQRERMEIVLENSPRRANVVEVIVGATEPIEPVIKVYPNPTAGNVMVDVQNRWMREITLFDTMGSIIREYRLPATVNPVNLNIEDLPDGLYLIVVTGERGEIMGKEKLVIFK